MYIIYIVYLYSQFTLIQNHFRLTDTGVRPQSAISTNKLKAVCTELIETRNCNLLTQ
jgi:hypothetical protein